MESVSDGKKEARDMPTQNDFLDAVDVSAYEIEELFSLHNRTGSVPAERDYYSLWNTQENVRSFVPDLESGCVFSPEYADIQRKIRKKR